MEEHALERAQIAMRMRIHAVKNTAI